MDSCGCLGPCCLASSPALSRAAVLLEAEEQQKARKPTQSWIFFSMRCWVDGQLQPALRPCCLEPWTSEMASQNGEEALKGYVVRITYIARRGNGLCRGGGPNCQVCRYQNKTRGLRHRLLGPTERVSSKELPRERRERRGGDVAGKRSHPGRGRKHHNVLFSTIAQAPASRTVTHVRPTTKVAVSALDR